MNRSGVAARPAVPLRSHRPLRRTAGLFGVGVGIPERVVSNDDLADRLNTSDEWIARRTGIRERRLIAPGDRTLEQLAIAASERALADAGVDAADVDQVLVCTVTADAVAPTIVHAIGARGAGAADLNAACAGFLYGVDQAAALVETRRADVVLVCAAEALSRITDTEDRSTAVLFGDGAAAVVVAPGELGLGCHHFVLGADGARRDVLHADRHERKIRMNGQEVYRHAVARMSDAMRKALARSGLRVEDLDLVVAHQANARIVDAVAAELGVPQEKTYLNVDRYANTSAVSIPLALWQAEQEGRLRPGMTIGLAAFGAGFVWGAGVIGWKEGGDGFA